jgi:hypothetical protein
MRHFSAAPAAAADCRAPSLSSARDDCASRQQDHTVTSKETIMESRPAHAQQTADHIPMKISAQCAAMVRAVHMAGQLQGLRHLLQCGAAFLPSCSCCGSVDGAVLQGQSLKSPESVSACHCGSRASKERDTARSEPGNMNFYH